MVCPTPRKWSHRVDTLDSGKLKIYYYRTRHYGPYIGRFLQHDQLGINPAGLSHNPFTIIKQYTDGMSLYQYVQSNPVMNIDPNGLDAVSPWNPPAPPGYYISHHKLQGVCRSYGCGESHKCFREASILTNRYITRFSAWANDNPGYNSCGLLAQAIMGMGLDSGLQWFSLRHMMNYEQSVSSTRRGHEFVGVFHRCNPGRFRNPGRSDKTFDPHNYFYIYPPLDRRPLPPKIKRGRLGWDR